MTQPKEYIITEEQLGCLILSGSAEWKESLAFHIRSRPHPAPAQGTSKLCFGTQHPISECCQKCNDLETCKQKQRYLDYDKKEAARQAREDVLKKVEDYLCSCVWSDAPDCPGATNGECICDGCERFEYPYPEDAREWIKSLRSEQEQPRESVKKGVE